jgi:putative cell wall-binding protein
MKKVMMIMTVALLAMSCEKKNCNCGVVQSDNVADYSVVIKNSCSKNNKVFYLSPDDWMNAYVGSDYCITNVTSW